MAYEFYTPNAHDFNPDISPLPAIGSHEVSAQIHGAKLRLCFISNPNIIHTRRWVTWFAQHGHTVCLLADVPLKREWSDTQVIDLSKIFYARWIRFPIWTAWLRHFLSQWKPDILHAHRINSGGWLAAASGFHPYVVTPWGLDIFTQPQHSWVARQLARYTLGHADLITSISGAMSRQAVELGARSDAIRSIQFGVELDIFKPGLANSRELKHLRQGLAIPENARIILSPRAVTPTYNLDIILQSIPIIHERFPEVVFIFIDYNTDPKYKKYLDGISAQLGLTPYLRWLPSTNNRAEMADLYRLSDIVVSVPSTDGGTPISVLEAAACARQVVCTDLLQLDDFIHNGETGILVPIREILPLAQAVIQLLEQPSVAAEYGQNACKLVFEKANSDVEMQHMEAIYFQLATAQRG